MEATQKRTEATAKATEGHPTPAARRHRLPRRAGAQQIDFTGLSATQLELLTHVPPLYKSLVVKGWRTKSLSPRQLIKLKCLDCSAYERSEVTACVVPLCPLFRVRPYQVKE